MGPAIKPSIDKAKYGDMEVPDAQKLKALEDENSRSKKLLAESMLDVAALKDLVGKTDRACRAPSGRARPDRGAGLLPTASLRARLDRSQDGVAAINGHAVASRNDGAAARAADRRRWADGLRLRATPDVPEACSSYFLPRVLGISPPS